MKILTIVLLSLVGLSKAIYHSGYQTRSESTEIRAYLSYIIEYSNPSSLDLNGEVCDMMVNHCDVYFEIQLFNRNDRLLYEKITKTYSNARHVEYSGMIKFTVQVPDYWYMKIKVWDEDRMNSDDLLGQYRSLPNIPTYRARTNYILLDLESEKGNPPFSLKVKYMFFCADYHYGHLCQTKCEPSMTYRCLPNGTKDCLPGYSGANCEVEDRCYGMICPPKYKCSNFAPFGETLCYCDDKSETGCKPFPATCDINYCGSKAKCTRKQHLIHCVCTDGWEGGLCQNSRAVTVTFPTVRESPKMNTGWLIWIYVVAVLLIIAIIIISSFFLYRRYKQNRARKFAESYIYHQGALLKPDYESEILFHEKDQSVQPSISYRKSEEQIVLNTQPLVNLDYDMNKMKSDQSDELSPKTILPDEGISLANSVDTGMDIELFTPSADLNISTHDTQTFEQLTANTFDEDPDDIYEPIYPVNDT